MASRNSGAQTAPSSDAAPDGARRTLPAAGAPFFQTVPLALIDVPAGRLAAVRPERVETIAKTSKAVGRLQPVNIEALPNGRFRLIAGAKRLAASLQAGDFAIEARVHRVGSLTDDRRRMIEIVENIDRTVLTRLEFAEHLAELKIIHERMYPASRQGGDRRSAKARSDQNEIFSFSSGAAEMTGLSRRAIEIAVAIVGGLSDASKARVRGTWLEDHQAGLKQLSEQTPDLQNRVLTMLYCDPPQAENVGDAIRLAQGGRLATPSEKLWASTLGNWTRLTDRQRGDFLDANEQAVRQHAKKRGWF